MKIGKKVIHVPAKDISQKNKNEKNKNDRHQKITKQPQKAKTIYERLIPIIGILIIISAALFWINSLRANPSMMGQFIGAGEGEQGKLIIQDPTVISSDWYSNFFISTPGTARIWMRVNSPGSANSQAGARIQMVPNANNLGSRLQLQTRAPNGAINPGLTIDDQGQVIVNGNIKSTGDLKAKKIYGNQIMLYGGPNDRAYISATNDAGASAFLDVYAASIGNVAQLASKNNEGEATLSVMHSNAIALEITDNNDRQATNRLLLQDQRIDIRTGAIYLESDNIELFNIDQDAAYLCIRARGDKRGEVFSSLTPCT
ncbi:hypothetical protein J4460_06425 [Candidatus Woesearchaeota archaeon]|nr:MAG: hypothetical protein QS99_C0010G0045 [archaeon GW2011_AR4]MBS3130279.1 hypothetical protein [Candidatus Woesearchaeota archaeon]HIH38210.1 hypothetical protein [Candidatus Woesearchaeota archaeon]HIH49505.1 hypothetical protein [Candidatus Woesearchaeota archaeon]HIJ03887.1 hypothetical protein [Candidatus Woesearchaeota archaeon]